jgi:hypothetical protein
MADIVDQETDALFWAQTGYKPGQKLDPHDPADAKWIPVWIDTRAKVQREHDAGTLTTTYNLPPVAQKIAEAHAADQAAAAHSDAAHASPDPWAAQQHVDAAAAALEHSAQKTGEAAAVQPKRVSPQLTKEAAQDAAAEPPPPDAPGHQHVAHAQAQAAHRPTPRSLIDKETDARFWAQLHYKPGQKLDPNDPLDKAMIPAWLDIYKKVRAEDRAGRLVLTYNNPHVAQRIADAHAADQAAALHRDIAATRPEVAHENLVAAGTAEQISRHRMHEAAMAQPPTASPDLAHRAVSRVDEDAIRETYERFWAGTHYKPGRPLDRRDPRDARMIPIWESVYQQVLHDRLAHGHPFAGREQVAQEQLRNAGQHAAGVHHGHHGHGPRRRPPISTLPPGRLQEYRAQALQVAHAAGAPYAMVVQHPGGGMEPHSFQSRAELDAEYAKLSEQHDQYQYVGAFDLTANPSAPVHDSVGIPAAEHVEEPLHPAPGGGPSPEGTDLSAALPEESKKWSAGKIAAIAAAVIAGTAGIVYAVKHSGKKSRSKVLVATPTRAQTARLLAPARAPGA